MVPEGWELNKLEDLADKQRPAVKAGPFGSALKKEFYEKTGYKVYGQEQVISNDPFHGNYYISEEKFRSLQSCKVEPGDILISLVGTIGKVLLLPANCESGIINPRLLRISTDLNRVAPTYLKYFLESETVARRLSSWAQGGTMGVLNAGMLKKLKVPLPPQLEQKKIAQILSTWDKAITTTEQLLANSQQQKKALMQQLLTGKKRLLDENGVRFSGEWRRVELNDVLDYRQPTPFLVKGTDYDDNYRTPVLTAGKTFVLGYTDEDFGVFTEPLPVIIFDDFTTGSKFVDFKFKAKSSAMKILTAKSGIDIKYVFEAMQLLDFAIGGHQRHWISIYSRLVIPLPSIAEQRKIATVLTSKDVEIEALQNQIEALRKEKKALMQQLLTGKRRAKVDEGAA